MSTDLFAEWAQKIAQASSRSRASSPEPAGDVVVVSEDGGLPTYQIDELWDEITYLGYHLHWSLAELLDLEHRDRRRLIRSVARLNQRAWEEVRARG